VKIKGLLSNTKFIPMLVSLCLLFTQFVPIKYGKAAIPLQEGLDPLASSTRKMAKEVQGGVWTARASMPTARYGLAAEVVNGKIYAIGGDSGFTSVEEFNPATNSWIARASMPTQRYYHAAAAVAGKIYVLGGWNGTELATVEEYDPAANSWTARASMSTVRIGAAAAVVDGKVYAIGGDGLSSVECYDPGTNTWSMRASLPEVKGYLAAAVVSGKIYAIGGYGSNYLSSVHEYDPVTNIWTPRANMPTPRRYLAAAVENGKIYVIGGHNGSYLSKVEVYDPVANTWSTETSMPTNRSQLAAVAAGNSIFVVGGRNDFYLATVEEFSLGTYSISGQVASNGVGLQGVLITAGAGVSAVTDRDGNYSLSGLSSGTYPISASKTGNSFTPASQQVTIGPDQTGVNFDLQLYTWRALASLPTPRYDLGAAMAANGKIYAIGGRDGSTQNGEAVGTNEEYDPVTNTWTPRSSMPTARFGLGVVAANGKVYAVGGAPCIYLASCNMLSTLEEYDPETDTWTSRPGMPTARYTLGVAATSDGKIYAIGGSDTSLSYSQLNTVEVFDPGTNTWSTVAGMSAGRLAPGVAVTSDDKIYVVGGGVDAYGINKNMEIYNPKTNTWTPAAPMSMDYGFRSVAAGSNDKIYAIGGYNSGSHSETEEYDPAANSWTSRTNRPALMSYAAMVGSTDGKIYTIGGLSDGDLSQVFEFTVAGWKNHSILGQIVDGLGNPVIGVSITANGLYTVTTDANGQYAINGLAPGAYTIIPVLGDHPFTPASRQVNVGPDQQQVDFEENQVYYSISGQIVDQAGSPVSGTVLSNGAGGTETTLASGFYTFSNLVSGSYTISPAKDGFTFSPINQQVAVGPSQSSINFVASPVSSTIHLTADPGYSQIQLNWDASSDPSVNLYRIRRSTGITDGMVIGNVADTFYLDQTSLVKGMTYCYKVDAMRSVEVVDSSNTACAKFGVLDLWAPDTYAKAGDTVIVPINARNATGISVASADIWLDFDPAVLECTAVSNTAMTANFAWLSNRNNTTGRVRISTIASPSKLLYGDGSLFWLNFRVKGISGSSSPLNLVDFIALQGGSSIQTLDEFNNPVDIPLSLSDGTLFVESVGMLGDVDDNGVVAAADALLALQIASGQREPTNKQRYTADVNGDGVISAADVSMVLFYAANGSWPLPPAGLVLRRPTTPTVLALGDIRGKPGQIVVTTLRADNLNNWAGGDWILAFDKKNGLEILNVTAVGVADGSPISFYEGKSGAVRISLAKDTPVSGQGDLVQITLRLPETISGNSPINIAEARLNDHYGRDYVRSVVQGVIERRNGSVSLSSVTYIPLVIHK
jgi:N-acetylneuraminic acid mutarotase